MKTKLLLLVFLSLVHVTGAFAQDKIRVSEKKAPTVRLKGYELIEMFQTHHDEYWSLTRTGTKYFVANYDRNLNLISKKRLKFRYDKKNLQFEKVLKFGGEYMFFLSFDNIKKKKKYLFYTTFEPDDLELGTDLTKVGEVKMQLRRTTAPHYAINVSDDNQHLFITAIPPSRIRMSKKEWYQVWKRRHVVESKKEKTAKFSFWVLNKQKEIVNYEKKHEILIEDAGDVFEYRNFVVDNDGTIYILGRNKLVEHLTRSERRQKKSKTWLDYETSAYLLEQIRPDGETIQFTTEEGVLYNDMDIRLDKKGNVHLIGLTAEQMGYNLVSTGLSYYTLSKSGLEVINEASAGFTEDVLDHVNPIREKKEGEKTKKELRRERRNKKREKKLSEEDKKMLEIAKRAALKINTIAYFELDKEEKPFVVLEERYVHIVTTTTTDQNGNTTTHTTYYYHYDDIILAKFDGENVEQNYYEKDYVSVNHELTIPLSVTVDDDNYTIMAQNRLIRCDADLANVTDYILKGNSKRKSAKGRKRTTRNKFDYSKPVSDNTLVAAIRKRKKTTWFKIVIQ